MEETNTTAGAAAAADDDEAPRLLAAIRSNAATARVLAGIALGGDPSELLATLKPAEEPEPSRPAFLGCVRESFWE